MIRPPRIPVAATAASFFILLVSAVVASAVAACGDGIVEAAAGESCDDGNAISGCKPDKRELPLDGCLNTCQRPMCGDPSRVREYDEVLTGRRDPVNLHMRLVSDRQFDFDQQPFDIEILHRACSHDDALACAVDADCGGGGATCVTRTVLHETVAGGIPDGNPPRWRYRNALAKSEGGIFSVKLLEKMDQPRCAGGPWDGEHCDVNLHCPENAACVGYYLLAVKAYVHTNAAASDMQTRVEVAGSRWAARGLWSATTNGWRFGKPNVRLEPWP